MTSSIEGIQYLGQGVNIFTCKCYQPPQEGRVIDPTGLIKTTPLRLTQVSETYGSSFAEFIRNFAVEAGVKGSYGGFSGSIEVKFSRDSLQSTTTKFLKLTTTVSGNLLSIGEDKTVLRRHLDKDFSRALMQGDPTELFEAYGTHVVVKANIGGMAEYYCHSQQSSEVTETQFGLAAKAKYKTLGGRIGGSVTLTAGESEALQHIGGGSHLDVYGGDDTARQSLQQGGGSWESWAGTIAGSPAFLGFPVDGLLPIWELADDTRRRQELQLAFKKLAAKNLMVRTFSFTGPSSTRPDAQVRVPDDYKLLSGGALIDWTGDGNLLTASFPESDNTWRALGTFLFSPANATMTAYALAVYDPDDIWDVRTFSNTGPQTNHPQVEISVPPDFHLVGGGAKVDWAGTEGNLLTASRPKDARTWEAKSKDHFVSSLATMTVYAIGLRSKVDGVRIESNLQESTSPSLGHPSAQASPGRSFVMVGGGAHVNWFGGDGNMLTTSRPRDSRTWEARSKDHARSSPATITAYALGIKVSN